MKQLILVAGGEQYNGLIYLGLRIARVWREIHFCRGPFSGGAAFGIRAEVDCSIDKFLRFCAESRGHLLISMHPFWCGEQRWRFRGIG